LYDKAITLPQLAFARILRQTATLKSATMKVPRTAQAVTLAAIASTATATNNFLTPDKLEADIRTEE
jgi:hypothetical protein